MIEPTQAHEPESPTVTSAGDVSPEFESGSLEAPSGYEFLSLIGEGGMGVVYRARDQAMGRDVAVKILRPCFTPRSAIGKRFIEEARITAQLQHPGIPPVHHVGELAGERPYLVMKLIKGDTLDALLKQRGDPTKEQSRFLAVFEQIAQAVGYAHAHRVIHRDLKPANVMVGSFGEVQVMDWGLAKVLDETQPVDETEHEDKLATEIRSLREGAEMTQAGSLLGTPAFMPPEQAIGAVDQIAERSDVFGLGAILCVILTGAPPFVSENVESTRRLAARGKLEDAFARLDRSGAGPELVALARRCLAAEPSDRPADGGEVAAAVSALRADAERRARQAEMERARAEVRAAEESKRRRVQRALALAVLTLIAVGGLGAWRIESVRAERRADQLTREAEAQARRLATERDVLAALNETQVLRQEGWKQADDTPRWALTLTAARSSLKRAEALAAAGDPGEDLRGRIAAATAAIEQDERDRKLLEELDRIEEENDLRYLIPVVMTNRQANRFAAAFGNYGVDLLGMPQSDAVAWLKSHRFGDRLTIALSNWERALPLTEQPGFSNDVNLNLNAQASASIAGSPLISSLLLRPSKRDRMKAIVKLATDDALCQEWLSALERNDPVLVKDLMKRPEFAKVSSRRMSALADAMLNSGFQLEHSDLVTDLLAAAYDRFPGEYWVNFQLASRGMLRGLKKDQDAFRDSVRFLSAAVAARPRSAIARVALGMTLLDHDKHDPRGLSMLRSAAIVDPRNPWPHLMMGIQAMETDDYEQLLESFRYAIQADPEISFFMIYSTNVMASFSKERTGEKSLTSINFAHLYDSLVEAFPQEGGAYAVRAIFRFQEQEYSSALEDFRKASALLPADSINWMIAKMQLQLLESIAVWKERLPAVQRGELKPNSRELQELAQYCAWFEKKYALASRYMAEALAAQSSLFNNLTKASDAAGWAVQAGTGAGHDAATLSEAERARLRAQALEWLRESQTRSENQLAQFFAANLRRNRLLDPVRNPDALEKLPPQEREQWRKFWNGLPRIPREENLEPAPLPRMKPRHKVRSKEQ
jgi:serine/threonine protein kinase